MKLEIGLKYAVLKYDGTVVEFKFTGATLQNETPMGEINGEAKSLYEILKGGYLSYWEITD